MKLARRLALVAGMTLGLCTTVRAQAIRSTPIFQQMVAGRMRLSVVSGRLVNTMAWHYGNGSSATSSGVSKEQVTFRSNGRTGSLTYERTTPDEQLTLDVTSEGGFSFRRSGKLVGDLSAIAFSQAVGEPVVLTVGPEGKQTVYRGDTLWHLLVTHPEGCRKHLVPLLEPLRSQWQLGQTAAALEKELLRAASDDRSDRKQWLALIAQLGDERFARREAADRQLRAAGGAVMGFLQQLDFAKLDAEQQFRIRRIITSMGRQAGDDTAETVASWLAEDPAIWLALATRPEAATRRVAVKHLGTLLGEPISVDPDADPASQTSQIEQLRARVEQRKPAGKRP